MANEEQVALLKQGSKVWNAWRKENPEIEIDLSYANLISADLTCIIHDAFQGALTWSQTSQQQQALTINAPGPATV